MPLVIPPAVNYQSPLVAVPTDGKMKIRPKGRR